MAGTYLTAEGLRKLKEELDHLKHVERPSISQQIAEARDKGDLSENAEYDAAKEAQGLLEAKIAQLENILRNARLIDEKQLDTSSVKMLNRVRVLNLKTKAEMWYTLVPAREANLKEGKISIETPIAKGLLNKTVGEKVTVQVPSGILEFEVLEITL
ncbi:MAG: transcription elongation factor GreA [Bacteroidota bacterium]|jgi:transcription elongation factor GreA